MKHEFNTIPCEAICVTMNQQLHCVEEKEMRHKMDKSKFITHAL